MHKAYVIKMQRGGEWITYVLGNLEGCSSTGQTIGLLPRAHQFEFHKSQSH